MVHAIENESGFKLVIRQFEKTIYDVRIMKTDLSRLEVRFGFGVIGNINPHRTAL